MVKRSPVYFPQQQIHHTSIKNKAKDSKEFLYDLIAGLSSSTQTDKTCIFCGNPAYHRTDEKPFTKSQIPLVGSSDLTNYFPSFQNGISICARCALAIQFAPIVSYRTGGKPCIVSSNNPLVIQELGKEALHYIHEQKLLGAYQSKETSGIFDEKFRSPQNAIFHLAYKVTRLYRRKKASVAKMKRLLSIISTTTTRIPKESQFTRSRTMFSVLPHWL